MHQKQPAPKVATSRSGAAGGVEAAGVGAGGVETAGGVGAGGVETAGGAGAGGSRVPPQAASARAASGSRLRKDVLIVLIALRDGGPPAAFTGSAYHEGSRDASPRAPAGKPTAGTRSLVILISMRR